MRRLSTCAALLGVGLCACSAAVDTPQVAPAPSPSAPAPRSDLETVIDGQNAFAGALYQELAAGTGNFALSPASISLAFGMTYAGARGETARQMAQVLRIPEGGVERAHGTLVETWSSAAERPYQLTLANRLFVDKSITFVSAFASTTDASYRAKPELFDFRGDPEQARLAINAWVEEQTQKHIKDLLPEGGVTHATRVVLTNAIYFEAKWNEVFSPDATVPADFKTPSGTISTPMMHMTGEHRLASGGGLKMLEMRYQGDDLAMQIVLPDPKKGLASLEARLADGAIDALAKQLKPAEVAVSLPRFTTAPTGFKLSGALQSMGMTDAFDCEKADFSGMASTAEPLCITEAFHQAYVAVTEAGTVAAAATAVVATNDAEPEIFVADRPFLFVIRDLRNGAIMFMGRVVDPSK